MIRPRFSRLVVGRTWPQIFSARSLIAASLCRKRRRTWSRLKSLAGMASRGHGRETSADQDARLTRTSRAWSRSAGVILGYCSTMAAATFGDSYALQGQQRRGADRHRLLLAQPVEQRRQGRGPVQFAQQADEAGPLGRLQLARRRPGPRPRGRRPPVPTRSASRTSAELGRSSARSGFSAAASASGAFSRCSPSICSSIARISRSRSAGVGARPSRRAQAA